MIQTQKLKGEEIMLRFIIGLHQIDKEGNFIVALFLPARKKNVVDFCFTPLNYK